MEMRQLRNLRGAMRPLARVVLAVSVAACLSSSHLPAPPLAAAAVQKRPAPPLKTADAVPRIERIAAGYPNRPYRIRGESYKPKNTDVDLREIGIASWYGAPFHGRPTSTGERYNMYAMTAAHPTMPLPSYARVRNLSNGRVVIVKINDRGPFVGKRVIDLSYAAAHKLRITGTARVEVVRLTHDEIRAGSWRDAVKKNGVKPPVPSGVTVAHNSLAGARAAAR